MNADLPIEQIVKSLIEAQIVSVLNNAPEAIDKLVKAALSKPVDPSTGKFDGYSSNKMPYLDFLVGEEIRIATREAVRTVIKENVPGIEAYVRQGLSSESMVAAITGALVGSATSDWRINVTFEKDKR